MTKTFSAFVLFFFYSYLPSFSQLDSSATGIEFDTVVLKEEPVVILKGTLDIISEEYANFYFSGFLSSSYDVSWLREKNGDEAPFEKWVSSRSIGFSKSVGLGIFCLPTKQLPLVYNIDAFYSRQYEQYDWNGYKWQNHFDMFGTNLKMGYWLRRSNYNFSAIFLGGYGLEYTFNTYTDPNGSRLLSWNDDSNAYTSYYSIQHYLTISPMMLLRILRCRLGIEPFVLAHLRDITKPESTFRQRLYQLGLKVSFVF